MQYWWLVPKHREGSPKRTHIYRYTHTQRQTYICSVTSSVLLSAEQMQGPARQLVACDDFLWALYGGSSWVHPGLGGRKKTCEQEHQKCTLSVHMCADVGLCAHVHVGVCCEAVSHFSCSYRVSREGKRKKEHYLKMPSPDIPLPYHSLRSTKHSNSDRHKKETFEHPVAKQTHFFPLSSSNT